MKVIWATAALVLVAGCGGVSSGADHQAKPAAKPAAAKLDSASAIGKVIGCQTPLKVDTESMAQEERYCKVQHHLVSIVRAPDRDTLKQYAAMAGAFGANVAIVNDNWGISSKPRSFVQKLAAKNKWQMV
jgi:hypothetical protein